MLVNADWLSWRPDLKLKGLGRSVSNHCPLILVHSIMDWGPKPFKFFNGWLAHPDFRNLCISEWDNYKIIGWKSYSLKEKLKRLKQALKHWSRNTFSSLNNRIEVQKEAIERLDRFDDVSGLEEEEIIERNCTTTELKRNMIWKESFLFQKAKSKWIKEGDVNSRFFHGWINKRIKFNGIEGLLVDNVWVEPKEGIRKVVLTNDAKNGLGGRLGARRPLPA
ncbi:hypothetical protein ACS0TY_022359 [Phlomoides rotata]